MLAQSTTEGNKLSCGRPQSMQNSSSSAWSVSIIIQQFNVQNNKQAVAKIEPK